ncbi:MAG: GNAT family N-acetyltransferase [candidate division SR1 bacterium]|nr:GNAT family N-acetyltransferase [candidate division SR1 bacterium]
MENLNTTTIETERLLLVPITMDYAEEIFKEFTPELTTYMLPKSPEKISETEDFIKGSMKKREQGRSYEIVVLDKMTKEFLGCGGISALDTEAPELGIWIKKSAFGKKLGREAVAGLVDRAQEKLKFKYLYYPVDKDNIPSRKVAESLGGVVQLDNNGQEVITIADTLDPNRKLNGVEYRIEYRIHKK